MKSITKAVLASAVLTAGLQSAVAYGQDPMMRVGLSKSCPSEYIGSGAASETLAPIAVALLANTALQLTSSLIDDLTTYLEKKPATTLADVYPADVFLQSDGKGSVRIADSAQCVWVAAAASFGQPSIDSAGAEIAGVEVPTYKPEELKVNVPFKALSPNVVLRMTGASSPIVFYFEAKVVVAPTGDAWRIVPKKMYYPNFIAQSTVFQSRAHDVAFTVQYSEPGKDKQPFATYSITETDLAEGTMPAKYIGKRLGWVTLPSTQPPGSLKGNSGDFYPVNVSAQLIETRKPNELADAMAKALGAKKSDIATAVSDKVSYALSAQTRADAAVAATTTLKTANDAYNTAYTAAKDAMAKYADAQKANDPAATTLALNNARVASLVLQHATGAAQDAAAAAGSHFEPAPDPTTTLPKG